MPRSHARLDGSREELWALHNVSFELQQGTALAVIGRNGAGKSTLLKILSRVTDPTSGTAQIRGRVGSLLEVGTGFHPELTGRENIYLSGVVLGMRKSEIRRRFDEIVEFAEVERFLETPVKRYSSGMYTRLAFAVAAHMDTEILLADEVLALGDLKFQNRCLGLMGDLGSQDRTVIFVSHNLAAVQRLCSHALVLDKGTLVTDAPIGEAIQSYKALLNTKSPNTVADRESQISITSTKPDPLAELSSGDTLVAEAIINTARDLKGCYLNLVIEDAEGQFLIHLRSDVAGYSPRFVAGTHQVGVRIPRIGLRTGIYSLWWRLYVENADSVGYYDSDRVPISVAGAPVSGVVDPLYEWVLPPNA
ncbi:MAG: ABC transporter ATP-binding protein [Actinobacteria bacterium]|nr:ABC transporter ATP-binding protein [Actinomycetota bacterium]